MDEFFYKKKENWKSQAISREQAHLLEHIYWMNIQLTLLDSIGDIVPFGTRVMAQCS